MYVFAFVGHDAGHIYCLFFERTIFLSFCLQHVVPMAVSLSAVVLATSLIVPLAVPQAVPLAIPVAAALGVSGIGASCALGLLPFGPLGPAEEA